MLIEGKRAKDIGIGITIKATLKKHIKMLTFLRQELKSTRTVDKS